MKRRILYIANSHEIGGGNRSLLTIIDNLRQRTTMDPIVFLPADGKMASEIRKRGVDYRIIPQDSGSKNKASTLISGFRYSVAVSKVRPSLIHANDLFCHKLAGISGKALRIPVISHMRFSVEPSAVRYHLRPKPEAIVFNSEFLRRSYFDKNPPEGVRAEVIYNGFDPLHYIQPGAREISRARWNIHHGKVVGILGNFAPEKGHELFLETAKRLALLRNDLSFVIVGDDILEAGKRRVKLQELTRSLGIEHYVHFAGSTGNPAGAIAGFDVLVVPSHFEPFGRVAVEGLLTGIPVIASRTGGLIEILEGVPGSRLVIPNNIDSFVEGILRSLNEGADCSKRVREIAETRFGEASCFRKLLKLYSSVMKDSHILCPHSHSAGFTVQST